jgi:type IV pilus assembly protein PilV
MKYSLKQNSGFSLIEILVSLVVLSIGLMGLAGLQMAALKGTNDAHYRTQASLLMMDLADRMRANQKGVAEGKYRTSTAINCANPPAKQCDSETCKGEELAAFDQYMINCAIKRLLPQGALTVNCASNDCQATGKDTDSELNKTHNITITWREKTSKEKKGDGTIKDRSIRLNMIP